MRRRTALAGALALCAAGEPASAEARLLGLLSEREPARRLGRAYLQSLDERPSAAALAGAIWRGMPEGGSLRAGIAALIRDDFAQRRTECVDGWLLSRTEARLCALAALS